MGTAAEQLLNGMYTNYVLLAVPLFILAAEFMNIGSMTERLLRFCDALVGRFRGGLAHVNVVQSIIFAGMSGSAIADAAGIRQADAEDDDAGRQVHGELRRRADRGVRRSSARSSRRRSRWCSTPSSPTPRSATCSSAASIPGLLMASSQMGLIALASRSGGTSRSRRRSRCASCPASRGDALPALMMPVVLLGGIYSGVTTPDRGRRGRRRLCAARLGRALPQRQLARPLRSRCSTARARPPRSAC